MKVWGEWEVVRHQVALCGRVLDPSGKPVSGARVVLTEMPEAFEATVKAAAAHTASETADGLPDRTCSRADGIFYFLDLPAGQYAVEASHARLGKSDEQKRSVAWDENGRVQRAAVDLIVKEP